MILFFYSWIRMMMFVLFVEFLDTSSFYFRTRILSQHLVSIDVHKTPHVPLYMKLPHHRSPSPCPPFQLSPSCLGLSIVNTLKLTKSRRRSKYDFNTTNFDSIDACDVKYLPPFFMVVFYLCFPQCPWVFLMRMVVL